MLLNRKESCTVLSFAVENVGETMVRAFFQFSSFNCVRPCSNAPVAPSIVYIIKTESYTMHSIQQSRILVD